MSFLLGTILQSFQKNAFQVFNRFRDVLYRLLLFLLTSTVIVWLSVFLYGSFYYTYMPAVSHVKPVHLQFSRCHNEAICDFPSSTVTLTKKGHDQLLIRGQQYKVYLDLEMPESPVNQRLGMFMVQITFLSKTGEVVHTSSRSAMLRYKSPLHQTLSTLLFSPLLLAGSAEEKQLITLELCDFYEDDYNRPTVSVNLEIQSKQVEIYSAQLRIYAHFTGLRYLMFHWPVVSACVGIGTNLFFLSVVAMLSWYRYLIASEKQGVVVKVGYDDNSRAKNFQLRRTQVKDFLLREKQRQNSLHASFSSLEMNLQPPGNEQSSWDPTVTRTKSLETLSPPVGKQNLNVALRERAMTSSFIRNNRTQTEQSSDPSSKEESGVGDEQWDSLSGTELQDQGADELDFAKTDSEVSSTSSPEQDSETDVIVMKASASNDGNDSKNSKDVAESWGLVRQRKYVETASKD